MKLEINNYAEPEKVGGYTNCVEGKDWILWEHQDGSIHVSRTAGMNKGVVGQITVLPKPTTEEIAAEDAVGAL